MRRSVLVSLAIAACGATPTQGEPHAATTSGAAAPAPPFAAGERAFTVTGGVAEGTEKWLDANEAVQSGYTVIDLSDDWTPYIFQEVTDAAGNLMANRYRQVFL